MEKKTKKYIGPVLVEIYGSDDAIDAILDHLGTIRFNQIDGKVREATFVIPSGEYIEFRRFDRCGILVKHPNEERRG